jgi:hypothetical protein
MKMLSRAISVIAVFVAPAFLVGCVGGIGESGPSDEIVKEKIASGVTASGFCRQPEMISLKIVKRGEPDERKQLTSGGVTKRTVYPIRARVKVRCSGESMFSDDDQEVRVNDYVFWQNSQDEWVFQ